MVEKIYDTLRALIYNDFPKDAQGTPTVYDRKIENWYFGDRKLTPSPLGVLIKGATSGVKDFGFGLRELEYTFTIQFWASNDDQETTERVLQEAIRATYTTLRNHRTIWVCDLCPFTKTLPLSPIHYIDSGVITEVKVLGSTSGGIATVSGSIGNAVINVKQNISGAYNIGQIYSCGLGITTTTFNDGNNNLSFVLSSGNNFATGVSSVMTNYLNIMVNKAIGYWQEIRTSTPPYYDWAGLGYQAIAAFTADYKAGAKNGTNATNFPTLVDYYTNLDSVINNNVSLVRLLQDVQVSEIKPSDDAVDASFLRSGEFTLKAKEIISVETYGPNNVDVNAI